MNTGHLPQGNLRVDPHRPPEECWGPHRLEGVSRAGEPAVRMDAATFDRAHQNNQLDRPKKCPICDHLGSRFLGIIYGYPIYNCSRCDVGFVWPQPSDELLKRYYGPKYWAEYMNDDRPLYERQPLCDHVFKRQVEFFDRLLHHRKDARILDVGAGDGTMLRLLQDRGYSQVQGLDLDPTNCTRAQDRLGVTITCHDFLKYEVSGWDAITLWAVIEHLKDPLSFVKHAQRLLKPGGRLVMMTGDNNSLCARLQGCFDMWLYPPEHLFFFGKRSLQTMYERAGFQEIRCRVGYQAWWKESILTWMRVTDSLKRMLKKTTRPGWRSTASNLLVISGSKPS